MAITATYVSSTSFTVTTNLTASFVADRKVKADCGVDGIKYCTVESSSYSAPNTTVTVSGDALTSNLASVLYGIVDSSTTGSLPRHTHTQPWIWTISWDRGTTAQKPAAGAIYAHKFSYAVSIPSGLTNSKHSCSANPTTNPVTISLKKNGAAAFGTIAVASNGDVTLTSASGATFAADDVLTVEFPAGQDATWAGITLSIYGTR